MILSRKRAAKGAKKTTKKVARKATAKKAPSAEAKKKATPTADKEGAARKAAARKAAKGAIQRDAAKIAAEPPASAASPEPSRQGARERQAASAAPPKKAARRQTRPGSAHPGKSAEKKPGLGAKWTCFSCGAKFYDLNRPEPICPKCHSDQREQPAKPAVVGTPPPSRRPSAPPISRLLDEEEGPEPIFDENGDPENAAELEIGKFEEEGDFLDDTELNEDSED
jgi:hypothetical protein